MVPPTRRPKKPAAIEGVRLIQHPKNRGYGAALKTGFSAASGDLVGFLDADGTYPPEYFPKLCQVLAQQSADLVIGSRMAGAESEMPLVRRVGNILFANLVSIITAQRVTDSASGMRVFKKQILEQLYPLPDGLNLTPVMSTRALHEHLKVVETPITYSERVGRSKLSVVRDGMRFANSIVWTALSYNPVRPLGLMGLGALAIAALITLGLIFERLSGVKTVNALGAFALFSAVVLAVAGVSILSLGISFNYFVALFHKRPVRQGLFGRPLTSVRWDHHFGWVGCAVRAVGADHRRRRAGTWHWWVRHRAALAVLSGQRWVDPDRRSVDRRLGADAGIGDLEHPRAPGAERFGARENAISAAA
jgi:hypothetical protein